VIDAVRIQVRSCLASTNLDGGTERLGIVSKFNKILSTSLLTKDEAFPLFSKGGLGGI
jgi:hypothetical protein